ncbi:MAG: hypothetical protein HRF50_07175 [Phycisphaerae bacterium]|jgi:competence protein ComGC
MKTGDNARHAELHAGHPVQAMTLAEVLISLSVVSLLFGTMMSAILVASRAAAQTAGQADVSGVPAALARLSDELSGATSITSIADRGITFVVPDRTGDGAPDTIQYAWSGTTGAPLVRTMGGASENVVLAVQSLSFDWELQGQAADGADQGVIEGVLGNVGNLLQLDGSTTYSLRSLSITLYVKGHDPRFAITVAPLNQPQVTIP